MTHTVAALRAARQRRVRRDLLRRARWAEEARTAVTGTEWLEQVAPDESAQT